MHNPIIRVFAVLAALAGVALPASAATFRITDVGSSTLLGTFDAPTTGGVITAMTVSVGGVTYDTLGTGAIAPVYNAGTNDLGGFGGPLGAVFNSVASGICGVGECAFSVYPIYDFVTPIPGEWYTDKVAPVGEEQSLGFGFYSVAPVPLPPALLSIVVALAALVALARRQGPARQMLVT